MWTEKDRNIVLAAKRNNPKWNWERIAKLCVDDDHSSSSCRQLFQRNETDPAKRSTPLRVWDRRQVTKMRLQNPPVPWEEAAEAVGFSKRDCKNFIAYHMTEKEEARGIMEGRSEQRRIELLEHREQMKKQQNKTRDEKQQQQSKSSVGSTTTTRRQRAEKQKLVNISYDNSEDDNKHTSDDASSTEEEETTTKMIVKKKYINDRVKSFSTQSGTKSPPSTNENKTQQVTINRSPRHRSVTSNSKTSSSASDNDNNREIENTRKTPTTAPEQKTTRTYKYWDKQDEDKLIRYYNRNLSWETIADKLDRTSAACRSKFYRITAPMNKK
ncbi:hypothetical protein BDA99DRAFT_531260 [Phascolomyces articulosus]|uniref:Myb-like domain-containing protein n=1 Tax=Phascolomyces articulosus TaxID=60185 RepID=A0AAD5KCM4_9FUNG|nr:hypothetical protein BDA99DRAFT_531260 [Phascolomyces articulosus]